MAEAISVSGLDGQIRALAATRSQRTLDDSDAQVIDPDVDVSVVRNAINPVREDGGFEWARVVDGTGTDRGQGVATDAAGNVYVTGYYQNTASVKDGATTLHTLPASAGSDAAFVAKFDASGAFQWARTVDGAGADVGFGIAADAAGGVYVTGYYNHTAVVKDGATVVHTLPASAGGAVAFVVKFTSTGAFEWARTIDGVGAEYGADVAADAAGGVYVAGYYQSTASVKDGATTLHTLPASAGSFVAFVAKFSTSGAFQWARTVDGSGIDYGFRVAADVDGNVYVVGAYQGTAAIKNGATTLHTLPTASGTFGAFVAKFSGAGGFEWTRIVDGSNEDVGYGVAASAAGVYVTGYYTVTATVKDGATTLHTLPATSGETNGAFVVKFSSTGGFEWARTIDGSGADQGWVVAADAAGIYVAGYYQSTASVKNGATTLHALPAASGTYATFVVRFSNTGTFGWARVVDDTSADRGLGVATDAAGGVYVTGYYNTAASVRDGATVLHTLPASAGGSVAFVVKCTGDGTLVPTVPYALPAPTDPAFGPGADFEWARTIGGPGYDVGNAVATDAAGDVYVAGYYGSAASVKDGATTLHVLPDADPSLETEGAVVVAKFTAAGAFVWARAIDGPGADAGAAVATDAAGIYVTGWYDGTASVKDGATTLHALPAAANRAAFVVKFTSAGAFEWARVVDGSGNESGGAVATDAAGGVYVTGSYLGNAAVLDGATTLHALRAASSSWPAWFVVKFTDAGAFVWARTIDDDGTRSDIGRGIATDAAGGVYVVGNHGISSTVWDGATALHALPADRESSVVKFTSAGGFVWARTVVGSLVIAEDVAIGAGGGVYVAGRHNSTAPIQDGATTLHTLPAAAAPGTYAAFVVKFTSAGAFEWARLVDGTSDDQGLGVAADAAGGVYVAGTYGNATVWDGAAALHVLPAASGTYAAFVVKFSNAGAFEWARVVDGSGNDYANGVAAGAAGGVYAAGFYNGTAVVKDGATTLHALPAAESAAAFVVKLTDVPAASMVKYVYRAASSNRPAAAVDLLDAAAAVVASVPIAEDETRAFLWLGGRWVPL